MSACSVKEGRKGRTLLSKDKSNISASHRINGGACAGYTLSVSKISICTHHYDTLQDVISTIGKCCSHEETEAVRKVPLDGTVSIATLISMMLVPI